MSKLISTILYTLAFITLTSYSLFAADYYVSPNGNNGAGTSWATAKTTFSGIPWSSMNGGDHLYIDGGASSITYTGTLTVGKSGTSGNYIYIMPGKYSPSPSGHSGRVIIDANNGGQSVNITSKNYVYLKGLECTNGDMGVYIQDNSTGCVVDSMNIYDWHDVAGIFLNGNQSTYTVQNTVIKYCRMVSPLYYNGQTDCIYIQGAKNTLIHNNFTDARNQDETNHNDNIQSYHTSGFFLYNNVCINDSVYSPSGGGTPMMINSENSSAPVIIYGNYLYMGGIWDPAGSQDACFWPRWYNTSTMSPFFVLNNTIVVNGPRCRGVIQEEYATMINNIVATYSSVGSMATLEENLPASILVDSTRYNLLYKSSGNPTFSGSFTGNGNTIGGPTWSQFTTTLGGSKNITGNPQFVSDIGYEPNQLLLVPDIKSNSAAVDAGVNLTNYINWLNTYYNLTGEWAIPLTDFYGNNRGQGNGWDIGAVEYGASPPPAETKKIRVIIIN